jgi:hypothetical protein
MKTIKTVVRIDFDNQENDEMKAVTRLEIFKAEDDSKATASLKIRDFLAQFPGFRAYKGWNDQVYPQFIIEIQQEV